MADNDKDKQIEEMAKDLYTCHDEYVRDGDDWVTDYNSTAKNLYNKGYRKASEVAEEIFAEIDDFQRKLRHIFLGMCGGNDYSNLNLLQIDNAIEALFDSHIAELKKKYTQDNGRDKLAEFGKYSPLSWRNTEE